MSVPPSPGHGRQPGTLAIDLGSSSTVVAFQAESPGARPQLLTIAPYSCDDPIVVPSLLWLQGRGQRPLIGRQVLDAGLAESPGPGLIADFKRWIGGGDQPAPERGLITAEEAGTLLLSAILQALPAELEVRRLVCSAPIEALAGYRRWLQHLAQGLQIPELALVDEPTAAALGCQLPPGSTVLVVDVGAGTTDFSLVELPGGEGRAAPIAQLLRFAGRDLHRSGQAPRTAQVLGKAGFRLGRRDLDRWLAAALLPDNPAGPGLLAACERLKWALSDRTEALTTWSDGQRVHTLQLQRSAWEALLRQRGLVAELDRQLDAVLAQGRAAGVSLEAISAVLPVGGGSRLPLIRSWLEERLPGLTIHSERPIEAVALGALALTPGVAIRDVLSRGVSLRTWDQRQGGHRWHPLFLPGQSWPTDRPLDLVLACSEAGQSAVELVFGEPDPEERHEVIYRDGVPMLRPRPAGDRPVTPWSGRPIALPLSPPGEVGQDRLHLAFSINDAGELTVTWRDLIRGDGDRRESDPDPVLALGMVR